MARTKKKATRRKKNNPSWSSHKGRVVGAKGQEQWLSEAEIERAVKRRILEDPVILDKLMTDFESYRAREAKALKEQEELKMMVEAERDASARKTIKERIRGLDGERKNAGRSAARVRKLINQYYSTAIRDANDRLGTIRMLPAAAEHRSQIASVERMVEAAKVGKRIRRGGPTGPRVATRGRRGESTEETVRVFADQRDDFRRLRAAIVTLEETVSSTGVSRRPAAKRASRGSSRGAAREPSPAIVKEFRGRHKSWVSAMREETLQASSKFKDRPTMASLNALIKVWRSAADGLIKIPGFKRTHALFMKVERESEDPGDIPEVQDVMRATGLDAYSARALLKLYMDARFVDIQLDGIRRSMKRGSPVTKTELRRIEERLDVIFGTVQVRAAVLTPAMARRDIKGIRTQIKEAKELGFLGDASTQSIIREDIRKLQRKYSGAKIAEWKKKDKTKILEDIKGLKAILDVAKKGVPERPRRARALAAAPTATKRKKVSKKRAKKNPRLVPDAYLDSRARHGKQETRAQEARRHSIEHSVSPAAAARRSQRAELGELPDPKAEKAERAAKRKARGGKRKIVQPGRTMKVINAQENPGRPYARDFILSAAADAQRGLGLSRADIRSVWAGKKSDFDVTYTDMRKRGLIATKDGVVVLTRAGQRPAMAMHRRWEDVAIMQANPKRKVTKKKAVRKKTPPYQLLINRCQKLWTHYCERPSKKRLEALYVHLDKMKASTSQKAKAERSRCLRAANAEAKRLKYKRK